MKASRAGILAAVLIISGGMWRGGALAQEVRPPNVMIILADDMGFSDAGCFGGEIKTPNLDGLAERGVRFSNFYNTGRCWSSRAALLTGYYAQQVGFDNLPGRPKAPRTRPGWAKLLPEYLKAAHYRSSHSGKWHLDGSPADGGFDSYYSLDDHGRYFSPRRHVLDGQLLPQRARDSGYYATTAIADHAIGFLKEHQRHHADNPFFSYVAFTSPHFPLQALPEDIARYTDRYSAGWDQLRTERWSRIQELGLVGGDLSQVEPDVGPPYDFPDQLKIFGDREVSRPLRWETLTKNQQEFQAKKMAIHAALVDRMDQEIGRIVQQIRAMGELENTLVIFLSDNGASAEIMVRDDGHDPDAEPGSAATHLCLGPGFSGASNTPFRRHKTWVHEGGIHTPAIFCWPAGMENPGSVTPAVAHLIDVVPTVLQLAGVVRQDAASPEPAPDFPGIQLSPAIRRGETIARESLWWCHEGNQAVRVDDWKLVKSRGQPWELFDLKNDPAETRDMADALPEKTGQLDRQWQTLADRWWPAPARPGGSAGNH